MQPTESPTTTEPTVSPTNEVISGLWTDDFVYVDSESVIDFNSSDIYDNGWYGLFCCLLSSFHTVIP